MKTEFAPVTMRKDEFLAEYGLSHSQLAKAIAFRLIELLRLFIIGEGLRPIRRSG